VQENALASHVHLTEFHHLQTIYCLNFENVETGSKTEIPSRLRQLLEKQYASDFDPERMEHVIAHVLQLTLSSMENEAENTIARAVISDFIYDFDDDPLLFDRRINHSYTLEQFQELPPSFWLKLLKMLIDSNWATVYTDPSTSAGNLLREEEEARIQELHEKMGENGRKKAGIRLKAALKIQSKIPPPELFHLVETPSIGSIGFLGIERHSNPQWAGDTLCNLYLDDINSSYVYLTVLMDTSELTLEEKKYLVLFSEAILEAPYVDNTQRFYSYDQMVAGLSRDVLNYETFFGIDWDKRQGGTRFSCGSKKQLFFYL
jgi:Zn-dependent M16 (insulinase) family peptidase